MLCEIDRNLFNNQLNGTISTFIGQLTALTSLSVTITILSIAVSVRVRVLITVVFALYRQRPQQQPAEWHDHDLYWTTDRAAVLVSDDYNWLVCAVFLLYSCADNSIVCVL